MITCEATDWTRRFFFLWLDISEEFRPPPYPYTLDSPKEGEIKASASTSDVAEEVDSCLWNLLDEETFSAKDFIFLVEAFPAQSRKSHDLLYAAIEKFIEKEKRMHIETVQNDEKIEGDKLAQTEQKLWSFVDVRKLSRSFYYRAIRNREMRGRDAAESTAEMRPRRAAETPTGTPTEARSRRRPRHGPDETRGRDARPRCTDEMRPRCAAESTTETRRREEAKRRTTQRREMRNEEERNKREEKVKGEGETRKTKATIITITIAGNGHTRRERTKKGERK